MHHTHKYCVGSQYSQNKCHVLLWYNNLQVNCKQQKAGCCLLWKSIKWVWHSFKDALIHAFGVVVYNCCGHSSWIGAAWQGMADTGYSGSSIIVVEASQAPEHYRQEC